MIEIPPNVHPRAVGLGVAVYSTDRVKVYPDDFQGGFWAWVEMNPDLKRLVRLTTRDAAEAARDGARIEREFFGDDHDTP